MASLNSAVQRLTHMRQLAELYDIDVLPTSTNNTPQQDVNPSTQLDDNPALCSPDVTSKAQHLEYEAELFTEMEAILTDFVSLLAGCQGEQYDGLRQQSTDLAAAMRQHLASYSASDAKA